MLRYVDRYEQSARIPQHPPTEKKVVIQKMHRIVTFPLIGIGYVLYFFGGDVSRLEYFIGTVEEVYNDLYTEAATLAAIAGTAIGFGLAAVFGTDPGPIGTPTLYRSLAMLACAGLAALFLAAVMGVSAFAEYHDNESYRVSETFSAWFQIGIVFGALASFIGLGYFVLS
jgi:hypothetical protein